MANKTCFVVMGFGTKTDYTRPKTFNLDKTYRNIIKPAAAAAGFDCIRADEIVHSGNINVPMYEQLLKADIVVADVSTYNCNAFYELGVRHALRPFTTIIISEDGLTFPFDVGQIAIRKYHHLGEGIDFDEVERMRDELSNAMKIISEQGVDDSPVYTFIKELKPPMLAAAQAIAAAAASVPIQPSPAQAEGGAPPAISSISILMEQAEEAIDKNRFVVAKALLADLHEKMPNDVSILHKLALATYKSKIPTELEALEEARLLLAGLKDSTDAESLGLLQAIHKRFWNLTKDPAHLDAAIWSSEKAFFLKNDTYNGINLAYLYNVRASISKDVEAVADFVLAQRTRRKVINLGKASLGGMKTDASGKWMDTEAAYWVVATLAEASLGLGNDVDSQQYMSQALALAPPQWMVDSTQEQLSRLQALLAASPLK